MRLPSLLCRSRNRSRRGAAAVEFAVCAPLLFLVAFGILEVGRALMVQQLLSNAARDGARSAMLEGATVEDVETAVAGYLGGSAIAGVTVDVAPDPISSAQGGEPVSVAVSVPFSSVSWLPSPRHFKDVTLSASVTMRREVFTSSPEEPE